MLTPKRPKFLDLRLIRLPLPGLTSILHRISGALLFLALPGLLWLLQSSLRSIDSYTRLTELASGALTRAVLLILLWMAVFHLCAGIRYLAMDLHQGVKLSDARRNAGLVLLASLLLTALLGWRLC